MTSLYAFVTVAGSVISSLLGYRAAKRSDSMVQFDLALFYQSVIRALLGIVCAWVALAAVGVTLQGIVTALMSAVGLDVVLKRLGVKQKTDSAVAAT